MMLALLAAGLVAWWGWRSGYSRAQLIAACSAAAGIFVALRGSWQIGLPMILPAVWLFVRQESRPRGRVANMMEPDEARRVLDVPPGADEQRIREAHRRLVAKVHPDQGGTAELAMRVNIARDVLLAELGGRYPR